MFKEFIIKTSLFIFKALFTLFNFMLQKKKTVFVTAYADNSLYVKQALKNKAPKEEIVILKDKKSFLNQKSHPEDRMYVFNDFRTPFQFIQSVYHLATSRVIFIDNYFSFIAGIPINKKQVIIQLWHTAGNIKTFGMQNKQLKMKSLSTHDRFQFNYDQIDYTVVGSDQMGEQFISAFNITNKQLIRTGVPKTDFFFNDLELQRGKNKMEDTYPFIKGKKVILYAPTYRDNKSSYNKIKIDYHKLKESISDDYVLIVKYHPRINMPFIAATLPEFVYAVSSHQNVNELLSAVDILITDYSSLPFEFALLNRPMVFYVPDLDTYAKSPGLWEPLEGNLPGRITKNTDELIHAINHISINQKELNDFNLRWNTYSDGQSSYDLINILYH